MLASTNIIHNKIVVSAVRLLLSIIRTLPTLVSALIATYVFGLGTLAGTTAIAVFTFAYIGKILYEEIETVDMGPFEAMEAMGATKTRAFISAIVPQVLPSYLSNLSLIHISPIMTDDFKEALTQAFINIGNTEEGKEVIAISWAARSES